RIHPEDREAVIAAIHRVIEGGAESWSGEYRFRRQDGSYAYVLDRGHIIPSSRGEPVRMVGGMTDLSERKETELRLREQAALIDQASDAIIVRSLDNRVLFWNRRAEEMYGWTAAEVTGRPVAELLYADPTPLEEATALLLEQGKWSGEIEQRARDGSKLTVLARWTVLKGPSSEPLSILAINTDITDNKRIEQQLLRAQRLESIGTLASGIAHDLNNILSPILMAIAMLKEQAQGPDALALVETLRSSAQRGADLVRQIVGIARGTDGHRDLVDLRGVLEEVCHIARDAFPKNIEFEHRAVSDLLPVRADATQLHQVLMNLYLNARDAMPDGGRLSATLENMELDEAFLAGHPEASPGPYVVWRSCSSPSSPPRTWVRARAWGCRPA
ncbi:PAS domain S-box protein, partial [bacterium CPR1]|nr:PAS domain S-box protein [bacterium CPR1]